MLPTVLSAIIKRDTIYNLKFFGFANQPQFLGSTLPMPSEKDIVALFELLLADPVRKIAYNEAIEQIEKGEEFHLVVTPNSNAITLDICRAFWNQFGQEQCKQNAYWNDDFLSEYFNKYPNVLNGTVEDTKSPFKVALVPLMSNIGDGTARQMENDRKKHLPEWHVLSFVAGLIHPTIIRGDKPKFNPTSYRNNAYNRQFEAKSLSVSGWGGCVPGSDVYWRDLQPCAGYSGVDGGYDGARVAAGPQPLNFAS